VQAISSKLVESGVDDKNAKSLILGKLGQWRINYIEKFNKEPDDRARDSFIDDLLIQAPTDIGYIWDTEKPLYELGDSDWEKVLNEIADEEPEVSQKVLEYFNTTQAFKDRAPSRAEIIQAYQHFKQSKQ
jgi:hypothetical protein